MLVSTTVVSTRRRRPRTTRRSRPRATSRATTSLSTGSSNTWANRISVLASGTRSPSMRQKARYTKLPRTSRSHSSKVQSWRCLRTSIRRTTAAGVPSRPRRRLCGWRWAKASATRSTRTSSSSRASICRRVESQSLSASGKSTSTRLRCRYARRTMAPPVRPPGLRGAPRELRSRATCEIALLSHHHASRVPSSTNNCAFGWVFRAAARTNTGCPRPNSHREVISHGLEDKHLRSGPALFLFCRRVHAVGPRVHREAVNLRLHREVLQLSEMGRIVHLKYGDCTTRARHIDAAEPGIEHHDVRALGHRQVGDRPTRVEVEHRQGVVALTGKERAMVLGVDRHAVIAAASLDGILAHDPVGGGIDHRENILVLKVDIDLARDRVVLRHARFAVEA